VKETEGLSLPSREKTWLYARLFALVGAVFMAVYGGCQWAQANIHGHPMYFEWERSIPFVPWMIFVYLSLNLLFWLPLFAVPKAKLKPFAGAMIFSTLVAGLFFYFLPGELGFARPVGVPGYEGIFERIYSLDGPKNLFPSLHIAYSTLCVLFTLSDPRPRGLVLFLLAWLAGIYASVLLVHQHHVADIVGGATLAWLSYRLSLLPSPRSTQISPIREATNPITKRMPSSLGG
jgi:membrane-associated phospholipid phosphatase